MNVHGLKEQFTPFYRSPVDDEDSEERKERRSKNTFLSLSSLAACIVSIVMIVMGAIHAAPIGADKDRAGVLNFNCTVMEFCG